MGTEKNGAERILNQTQPKPSGPNNPTLVGPNSNGVSFPTNQITSLSAVVSGTSSLDSTENNVHRKLHHPESSATVQVSEETIKSLREISHSVTDEFLVTKESLSAPVRNLPGDSVPVRIGSVF